MASALSTLQTFYKRQSLQAVQIQTSWLRNKLIHRGSPLFANSFKFELGYISEEWNSLKIWMNNSVRHHSAPPCLTSTKMGAFANLSSFCRTCFSRGATIVGAFSVVVRFFCKAKMLKLYYQGTAGATPLPRRISCVFLLDTIPHCACK